jgi:hypothetical protein
MRDFLESQATAPCTLYRLFAVLVHAGTARGGHYYVFIRPCGGPKWYKFNDRAVSEATEAEAIQGNFGDSWRKDSAYLLYYVRADAADEVFAASSAPIADHIREYADRRWERPAGRVTFTVYTEAGLRANAQQSVPGFYSRTGAIATEVARDATLEQLYDDVAKELGTEANLIRIWELPRSGGNLEAIVSRSGKSRISELKSRRLFTQARPELELLESTFSMIVFLK